MCSDRAKVPEIDLDKKIETTDVTRPQRPKRAKGKPGAKPMWSSSAKTLWAQPPQRAAVSTTRSARERSMRSIFGDVEQANTRSVRFLITGQLASEIVSPDALALVRFGLHSANDPRMRNTVKVIDTTLKRATSSGATWAGRPKMGMGKHRWQPL